MTAFVKLIVSHWVFKSGPAGDIVVYAATPDSALVVNTFFPNPNWPDDPRRHKWTVSHKGEGRMINLHRLCRSRDEALELAATLEAITDWGALHEMTKGAKLDLRDRVFAAIDRFMDERESARASAETTDAQPGEQ